MENGILRLQSKKARTAISPGNTDGNVYVPIVVPTDTPNNNDCDSKMCNKVEIDDVFVYVTSLAVNQTIKILPIQFKTTVPKPNSRMSAFVIVS